MSPPVDLGGLEGCSGACGAAPPASRSLEDSEVQACPLSGAPRLQCSFCVADKAPVPQSEGTGGLPLVNMVIPPLDCPAFPDSAFCIDQSGPSQSHLSFKVCSTLNSKSRPSCCGISGVSLHQTFLDMELITTHKPRSRMQPPCLPAAQLM